MSGNMAFFFDLVALYLVALYLVALYLVALYLVALYLVALPGGPLPGGGLLRSFLILPSQNKMRQISKIVLWIKKDSTNTMQINGLRCVK
jgi:hypothetical protein